jgi:hypothetical protein
MLRKMQAFLVFGLWTLPAAAEDAVDDGSAESAESDAADFDSEPSPPPPAEPATEAAPAGDPAAADGSDERTTAAGVSAGAGLDGAGFRSEADASAPDESAAEGSDPDAEPPAQRDQDEWNTFLSGYFRAPVAIGLSPRANPDDPDGESHLQMSYGPNRTVDANYYSFAYTRLQEQDWAEVFIHAKKQHAEAVVGWMGYWFQSAGFRNYDAGWVPGMAYLTLDTDFEVADTRLKVTGTHAEKALVLAQTYL